MKLFRYEFAGDGIFNALDYLYDADMDMDDYKMLCEIENMFEDKLPTTKLTHTFEYKYYFTSYGNKFFEKQLNNLKYLFDTYCKDYGSMNVIIIDNPSNDVIIYKDKYQMAIINN